MHLIKIVARIFYAQSNAQKKERFLALFLMGTFREGLCFPRPSPLQNVVLGPENHTKTGFVPRGASTQKDSRLLYRQLQYPLACCQKRSGGDSHAP